MSNVFRAYAANGEQLRFQGHAFDDRKPAFPLESTTPNGFADVRHMLRREESRKRAERRQSGALVEDAEGGLARAEFPVWIAADQPLDGGDQFWRVELDGSYRPVSAIGAED